MRARAWAPKCPDQLCAIQATTQVHTGTWVLVPDARHDACTRKGRLQITDSSSGYILRGTVAPLHLHAAMHDTPPEITAGRTAKAPDRCRSPWIVASAKLLCNAKGAWLGKS